MLINARSIKKANISMRPTTKIKQQNNFIIEGNAIKADVSQIPGNGPIFVKQAIDIATEVENA